MAKVHPNVPPPPPPSSSSSSPPADERAAAAEEATTTTTSLTVWRKSLLFNCRGYTVFDARGDLAYRVDSYDAEAEVVLMDAAGRPAFTLRRRRLISLSGEQWLIYAGEETRRPVYAVKRGGGGGKSMARVIPCGTAGGSSASASAFEVEGSYARRRCVVYDAGAGDGERSSRRAAVAEVQPKEAVVGTDVFRLVVQPGVDVALAMAVVVALDQLFGRPSLLRSWSSSSSSP